MTTIRLASKLGLNHLKVWEGNLAKTIGKSFYQLNANTIDGKPFDFEVLKNNVVLISNVASKCDWTSKNYDKFVAWDKKYRGNLQIMAFPSNEFGKLEPHDAEEIRDFVKQFKVKFHMMEKTNVNGPETHEVFRALKQATKSEDVDITWNFETKFLIAKEGFHVERFSNAKNPSDIAPFIDRLVGEFDEFDEDKSFPEGSIKSQASFVYTG